MFQADKKPILFNKELTGNPITFNSRLKNMPLSKCEITIPITQTGNGTPAPDNIRDFVGVQGVTIGQTSGYGEYFQGLLNGTYGFVDLGSLTWTTTSWGAYRTAIPDNYKPAISSSVAADNLAEKYNVVSYNELYDNRPNNSLALGTKSAPNIYILADTSPTGYLIMEVKTPTTPVTPQEFATLCQAFGITGNTYQITFGQTIYSGVFDVKTGILTITHAIEDMGDMTWYYRTSSSYTCFYSAVDTDVKLGTENTYCSGYLFDSQYNGSTINEIGRVLPDLTMATFTGENNQGRFAVKDSNYSDVEAFTTAVTGIKLVYELAEPIEIPLGGYLIEAVKGVNNIFANVGITTVDYVEVK